jgi:peptidoglycan/xylan/chitin deacetylase (PgdA/CDA1 family)
MFSFSKNPKIGELMKKKNFSVVYLFIIIIIVGTFANCIFRKVSSATETMSTTKIKNDSSYTVNTAVEHTTQTTSETTIIKTTGELSIVITSGIVNHGNKQIALTFDSGWEYKNTEKLLDILDNYNVKATFFTRGLWAKDHPDFAIVIVNHGHDLENHSLTHGHMIEMTDSEVKDEISKTTDIIKETTGFTPQLFRPPYGEYDKRILKILKEQGYNYTILWTVDSLDWAEEMNGEKITKDYLVNRVLKNASNNGIILMHVGGYETINALPDIITGLRSKGYELVKVKDML